MKNFMKIFISSKFLKRTMISFLRWVSRFRIPPWEESFPVHYDDAFIGKLYRISRILFSNTYTRGQGNEGWITRWLKIGYPHRREEKNWWTLGNGIGRWLGAICHRIARIGWVMFKVINTGVVTITGEGIMDFSSVKLEREGSDISRGLNSSGVGQMEGQSSNSDSFKRLIDSMSNGSEGYNCITPSRIFEIRYRKCIVEKWEWKWEWMYREMYYYCRALLCFWSFISFDQWYFVAQ